MKLIYEEQEPEKKLIFPHWINYEVSQFKDDILAMMDVNQWCGEQFGDLGEKWGFERSNYVPAINGSVMHTLRNPPKITYSWRFLNQSDAALFEEKWGDGA